MLIVQLQLIFSLPLIDTAIQGTRIVKNTGSAAANTFWILSNLLSQGLPAKNLAIQEGLKLIDVLKYAVPISISSLSGGGIAKSFQNRRESNLLQRLSKSVAMNDNIEISYRFKNFTTIPQ